MNINIPNIYTQENIARPELRGETRSEKTRVSRIQFG